MEILLNVSSGLFLLIGSFLCLTGGIGILRFPDFYTRMHAVGVTETLATAMILIGLILYSPDFLVDVKLLIILLMTLFLSPTASHALANAAMNDELSTQKDSKPNSELTSSNP